LLRDIALTHILYAWASGDFFPGRALGDYPKCF